MGELQIKLQRIKQYACRFGVRKTVIKAIKAVCSSLLYEHRSHIILQKDLAEEVRFTGSRNNKIRIQRIEESHFGILKELGERWDYKVLAFAAIHDYFERGYPGFLAFLNGEIIGSIWWIDGSFDHPDLLTFNIELEENDMYGFNFFIPPEHRGKANAVEFLHMVFLALKELGYQRFWGVVDPQNISARWLYKLVGFKDIKKISQFRFLHFFLIMDKTIYLKSNRKYVYIPFDFRAVFPFRMSWSLNARTPLTRDKLYFPLPAADPGRKTSPVPVEARLNQESGLAKRQDKLQSL